MHINTCITDALETDNASGPQTKIHVKSLLKDPLEDKEKEVHVSG